MADIAMVFHWQPQAFENMTVTELMQWREKARERSETETDYLMTKPNYIIHRWIFALLVAFWLTVGILSY